MPATRKQRPTVHRTTRKQRTASMQFRDPRVLRIETPEDMQQLLKEKGNSITAFKKGTVIEVYNKMERGRTYRLEAAPGKDMDPEFKPELTPAEMLARGVFEGKYCNDQLLQFPKEWYLGALKKGKLCPGAPDPTVNEYGVKSRQPLKEWQRKGWVPGRRGVTAKQYPILSDPKKNPHKRGWFEWYMCYYCGERNPELDRVQIQRWKAFRRHAGQIRANCKRGDQSCRPVQRQALLQWAYDPKRL